MRVTNISEGRTTKFSGCQTYDEMKSRLSPKQTIGVYCYGGDTKYMSQEDAAEVSARRQVEVRTVRFGRRVIVATAKVAE